MVFSLKSRKIIARTVDRSQEFPLELDLEEDGTLIVSDASAPVPSFIHRITTRSFPDDAEVRRLLEEALGVPIGEMDSVSRGVDLDESVYVGLKKMPVDIFDSVYLDEVKNSALVLCVDIRNFSSFLCAHVEESVFKLIKDFTSNFLSCVNQFGYGCSYYKLMGDGAIVIWDETDPRSVQEALLVFDTYTDFANEELFKPFGGLGLAGALVTDKVFKYEISAETSQLKYRDYVGYGINLACRLQGLARKDELVINRNLAQTRLIPFRTVSGEKTESELHLLKGLKDEDCNELFFYNPVPR
jgi:hypothetical protein